MVTACLYRRGVALVDATRGERASSWMRGHVLLVDCVVGLALSLTLFLRCRRQLADAVTAAELAS